MGLFPALVPGMPAPAMAACRGGAIMPPFTGAGNHDGAPGRTHHGYEPCRRGDVGGEIPRIGIMKKFLVKLLSKKL
ncbi:hypothetical protein [Novacetimonas pomaceti]|uniref:hypothetical protein n=1 Tax=Novacetimonas pomaceti TaxID=2021998 RepID=UPI001C2DDEE2|nr:hypothetical protein [Novacetimonas pomaceti]